MFCLLVYGIVRCVIRGPCTTDTLLLFFFKKKAVVAAYAKVYMKTKEKSVGCDDSVYAPARGYAKKG